MTSRTKIVATLGPACDHPPVLDELLAAGVDVVRLNLSHGSLDAHIARLHDVRAAADRIGRHVAVLADLPGPKVRAGQFPEGGVLLSTGDHVTFEPGVGPSVPAAIMVDYPTLLTDVRHGDKIVLGDGAITIEIAEVTANYVRGVVVTGGPVNGRPGVHLPSERMSLSTPTDDDLVLARAMAEEGADFLGVSFVRRAHDLRLVRAAVAPLQTRLVAKIETMSAVTDLEAIAAEADGVMVARGDLGIECPLEDVPHLQKRIIRYCVEMGIPVITATQMMESMVSAPSPTRAEVSDIANAVFDGTDALMLSAETAIGADPVEVVKAMVRIATRAEAEAGYRQWAARLGRVQRVQWTDGDDRITMAITHAAGMAAADADAQAILCCTRTGRTARAMARFRPLTTLIGLSPDEATLRAMALTWGVRPVAVSTYRSTDELVWFAIERSVEEGLISTGQIVLVLAGAPDLPTGASTDVLRIVRVHLTAGSMAPVQHDGIHSETAGDPAHPLIVLVHGSMDRSSGMLRLSRRLDDDYFVVRYDRRGYGRSSHHGSFGMDQQVADLVALLDGRRAVLVGHSFGGNVALSTAARHPQLVAAVAVYETPLSWTPWWPATSAGSQAIDSGKDPADAAEDFMRRMIGDRRWSELPERTRQVRRSEGPAMIGELADIRGEPPWRPEDIRVPLVAGHGSLGADHHKKGMAYVVDNVPGAQLVVMDGCGHPAPNTHSERVRRELVEPALVAAGAPWSAPR